MNAPAAIQGDFVDLRFVKGRKVCQIIIEIPIEAGASFVAAFGTPNPATTVPVAIARLGGSQEQERKGGKLAQKAGILCSEGAFAVFLTEEGVKNCKTADDCKEAIYLVCGVNSRVDLDHDGEAAVKFKELEASYKAWLVAA